MQLRVLIKVAFALHSFYVLLVLCQYLGWVKYFTRVVTQSFIPMGYESWISTIFHWLGLFAKKVFKVLPELRTTHSPACSHCVIATLILACSKTQRLYPESSSLSCLLAQLYKKSKMRVQKGQCQLMRTMDRCLGEAFLWWALRLPLLPSPKFMWQKANINLGFMYNS